MPEILFRTLEEVLALHDDAITFAGGASGLRSIDRLQGAIAQPEASFAGQLANTFPFGMAAAYAYYLSRNQSDPFAFRRPSTPLGMNVVQSANSPSQAW